MKTGAWNALGAYLLWGLFPLYWKMLQTVPPLQIIAHRVAWSFLLLLAVILLRREGRSIALRAGSIRILSSTVLTGLLLGVNWLVYIWGVNSGHIVETSLGYFINPLLSLLLGVLFLRERLRLLQWLPVGMAAIAVIYLTLSYGALPWIALTLAGTFALYGLLKKIAPLGALPGLTIETGALLLPSVLYLVLVQAQGTGAFTHNGIVVDLLLAGAGIVTTLPLLMFASAARSIPLWMVGLLQYIAPTMQFLIGVLVFKEPFTSERAIGFAIIWMALIIFWLEGFWQRRRSNQTIAG
ncbi:MAG: EamA family transporter RarD [Chloroflexi bacterium]|nr:EamA family transporter RarD [Chloroflexota bacterium]